MHQPKDFIVQDKKKRPCVFIEEVIDRFEEITEEAT
jgi:hypothetical protein